MSERLLNTEKIYSGRVISLRKDEILTDKGVKAVREVVSHGGGAAILAVKEGKIMMERQFRYPYGETIWEIPAGKRDVGEDFIVTAKRELEEETGLIPLNLKEIFKIYPTPGYTNEVIGIFYADEFATGKVHLDEGEELTSRFIPEDEVFALLERGEIKDGKTLIALLWYKNKKNERA